MRDNTSDMKPGGENAELPPIEKPPFLKLADLAKRWDVSEREVIEMVRRRGVPFMRMTHAISRVKWDKVRFSLPAIEVWEQAIQERFKAAAPLPPPGTRRSPRPKPKGQSGSRLGNWRDSSVG